jgi:heat-inducible transcriptional repressor
MRRLPGREPTSAAAWRSRDPLAYPPLEGILWLAPLSLEGNRSSDEKSLRIKMLERIHKGPSKRATQTRASAPSRPRGAMRYARPMSPAPLSASHLAQLDERSREVFRQIVDGFLASGEPVGSRHISRVLPMTLSPASVRNVMQDLEELGLVYAPHISAGRLPTEMGLRFFVDSLLQIGDVEPQERARIEAQVEAASKERDFEGVLAEATGLLSGLALVAGVVAVDKADARLKQIDFVRLEPERVLAILVAEDGGVENRVLPVPRDLPASALIEAANYLNARIRGRTLADARREIEAARAAAQAELDALTAKLVEAGIASWGGAGRELIVRGQAHLLEDLTALGDLERIRLLFADLETKTEVIDLLERAEEGEGVRIFIGSENKLFSLSGSSMITAPLRDANRRIVGALGVIGPTRLNYARIVPMVDYTAKLLSRVAGGG